MYHSTNHQMGANGFDAMVNKYKSEIRTAFYPIRSGSSHFVPGRIDGVVLNFAYDTASRDLFVFVKTRIRRGIISFKNVPDPDEKIQVELIRIVKTIHKLNEGGI
jgi:hypothetical protein